MLKGTCMQTWIPVRKEAQSESEMVTSILFGENYSILETGNDWIKIKTDFDNYEGWISSNTYHELVKYTELIDTDYVEAHTKGEKIIIPCGGLIPDNNKIYLNDKIFELKINLKPNSHLPLRIRLVNSAKSLLNAPYLWGGRCFMGIDCSGLIQVIYKANGINLPRDTSQQINEGKSIEFNELESGDLVFFAKPEKDNVSHVGLMINSTEIIHASGKVKIDKLSKEGIVYEKNLLYKTIAFRRISI